MALTRTFFPVKLKHIRQHGLLSYDIQIFPFPFSFREATGAAGHIFLLIFTKVPRDNQVSLLREIHDCLEPFLSFLDEVRFSPPFRREVELVSFLNSLFSGEKMKCRHAVGVPFSPSRGGCGQRHGLFFFSCCWCPLPPTRGMSSLVTVLRDTPPFRLGPRFSPLNVTFSFFP